MTLPPAERKIRAGLRIIRLLNVYLPLPLTRWLMEKDVARVELSPEIRREPVVANGVRAEWLIPPDSAEDQVLLYLHGGSFMLGLSSLHLEMISSLVRRLGTRALLVDYRLAPEHPFPAALDDCLAAYRWLLQQGITAEKVVVAGDSAGGNLTLALLMALRAAGDPLPAAAAALSPVADLTNKDDLFERIYDPLLHPRLSGMIERAYVAGNDPADPLISPALGEWHGLPPLLIHAGEDEALRYDALRVGAAARAAGVDAQVEIYPRMWHVWHLQQPLPQAVAALDEIAHFLKAHLKR